jgi:hypothetical protein
MNARLLHPIRLLSNGRTLIAACGVWATAGIVASFVQTVVPPIASILYVICAVAGGLSALSALMLWARDIGRDDTERTYRDRLKAVRAAVHVAGGSVWSIRLGLISANRCGNETCRVERKALEDALTEARKQVGDIERVTFE